MEFSLEKRRKFPLSSSGDPISKDFLMKKLAAKPRGQMMVLYACAIVTLLGAMALGTDVAVMYWNWQDLQKAADAAVLAGGASLPGDTTQAAKDVNTYLANNGVNTATEIKSGPTFGTNPNDAVPVANDTVSITLQRTVPYSFARVLGLTSANVQVTATAWAQPSGSVGGGIVPIALNNAVAVNTGVPITFYGDISPSQGPSHWGGLNINGDTGGGSFAPAIQSGYNGVVSVGDTDALVTGLKNGPVKSAFQTRLDDGSSEDPSGTWNDHTAGDPRDIVVPLTSGTPTPGNSSDFQITGFVHIWLTGVTGNGNGANPLSITGIVFTGPAEANPSGGGGGGAGGSNIDQVVLIQ
jgi:Flp pilus assembly protein TadG